jgi:hypothetical protein
MYEKEVLEYLAGLELQQSTHIVICIQRYVPVSATSHKFCARRKYSIHIPVLIAIGGHERGSATTSRHGTVTGYVRVSRVSRTLQRSLLMFKYNVARCVTILLRLNSILWRYTMCMAKKRLATIPDCCATAHIVLGRDLREVS